MYDRRRPEYLCFLKIKLDAMQTTREKSVGLATVCEYINSLAPR